jgi:hypothetical protein
MDGQPASNRRPAAAVDRTNNLKHKKAIGQQQSVEQLLMNGLDSIVAGLRL